MVEEIKDPQKIQEEAQKKDDERMADLGQLAKNILRIISVSDITLGKRDKETEHIRYKETAMEMIKVLYNKNVLEGELDIIFQLMKQAIAITQTAVEGSISLSKDIALTNYWGKHPDEITLQDIDNKMRKDK